MTLSQVLRKILSNYKSIYDAAQEISLQTGEKLDTVHHRLSKWCKKDPETWVKINQALNLLGYEIQIKKRGKGNMKAMLTSKTLAGSGGLVCTTYDVVDYDERENAIYGILDTNFRGIALAIEETPASRKVEVYATELPVLSLLREYVDF
ncbi:MAG: hypothetical protein ACO3YX_07175 [Candidatus Nanopelagicaceae bacterium]